MRQSDEREDQAAREPLVYGRQVPKLSPDDTDGKPAVLTIATVRRQNMARPGTAPEVKLVLTFNEFDDREYVPNATAYRMLCNHLGIDELEWVGQLAVFAPTTTTYNGKSYEKLHIASDDRWGKLMAAYYAAKAKDK